MSQIPEYLRPYAKEMTQKDSRPSFKLRCSCGCETFLAVKNQLTPEEEEQKINYQNSFPDIGWHSLNGGIDANGKPYAYIRKFFFFKKYINIPPEPVFMSVNVVKAVCADCHKEIILFDSRCHGYDAQFATKEQKSYLPHFDNEKGKTGSIRICIDPTDGLDDRPELFSWINISVTDGTKKRTFFDAETS